jgi:uncharacterized protein (DUF1684 family)
MDEVRQALMRIKDELASLTPSSGPPGGPSGAKYIVQQPHADLSAEQALSTLATGILKSMTVTGVVSIATPGTDYALPSTVHKGEFHIPLFSVATPVAFF